MTSNKGHFVTKTGEAERLEKIAQNSQYAKGLNYHIIKYSARIFQRHMVAGSVLELGPAEGVMTSILAEDCADITVVEGSEAFCGPIKNRFPAIDVVNSLFEEFKPARQYSNIILGHVLEHVINPVGVLSSVNDWLSPGGKAFAAVPNCRSVHRQAGVILGLLRRESDLNGSDNQHGHRRVYDPETFRAHFLEAGLNVEIFGGYFLKPLSNVQIESSWSEEMIYAYMAIGERYPDIASNIYIVAGKKGE